jgi:tRNA dimethylallyltransferase
LATNNQILLVLVGPTAVGKTKVAVELAKQFNTCIVSADSRQFYKELQIGTAKPTLEEQENIPHYFIDSHSIDKPLDVGAYVKEARIILDELFKKHSIVILVGGSGLYIDSLCFGLSNLPNSNSEIRARLNQEYKDLGLEYLQNELRLKDPEYYQKVDIHNPVRIIRALEVIEQSGKPFSVFLKQKPQAIRQKLIFVGLMCSRALLYQRINDRLDQMMQIGLLKEIEHLFTQDPTNSILQQTVGYKEFISFINGSSRLEEALELAKKNSRELC